MIFIVLVVCSITAFVLESHPVTRLPLPLEAQRYLTKNFTLPMNNAKLYRDKTTYLLPFLAQLDFFCRATFTAEWNLRFLTAPNKFQFLRSIMNIIELVSWIDAWLIDIIRFALASIDVHDSDFNVLTEVIFILRFFRILRVCRIIRLSRLYTGMRVIFLALRDSVTELALITFVILICMVIFSSAMYYTEYFHANSHFTDIPVGFWWSVVTMTTVGYGDKYPLTPFGYVVGGFCTILGIIVTGLPIPIISSNFDKYYEYMQKRKMKKKKSLKRDKETPENSNLVHPEVHTST